jgi:hypothetical protein
MKTGDMPRPWVLGAVVSVLILSATVACSSQIPAAPAQTARPVANPTFDYSEDTEPPAVAGGSWTGTITFDAVAGVNKTTHDTSGNPGDVYYETSTTTETDAGHSTDTFAIATQDQADVTYGIDTVDLKGTASTQGNEDYKSTIVTQKQNSGCTWTEEVGDETSGAWTDSGTPVGELRFSEDGSYSMTIHASTAGPNGEEPVGPQIDHHTWIKNSDISAGCTGDPVEEFTEKQGPLLLWASSFLDSTDVNDKYVNISGQVNAANPGTTVDGTSTWKVVLPELTLTITWHLVHDSPIVLPHS